LYCYFEIVKPLPLNVSAISCVLLLVASCCWSDAGTLGQWVSQMFLSLVKSTPLWNLCEWQLRAYSWCP